MYWNNNENPEVLKLVPGHLKTKKMCKHAVRKLPFLIRYAPDQCKIQKFMIKLFQKTLEHYGLSLTATKMSNCVIRLLPIIFMH